MTTLSKLAVVVSFAMTLSACHSPTSLPPRGGDHPAEPRAAMALYEPPADPFASSPTYTLVPDVPRAVAGRPPRGAGGSSSEDDG